MLAIDRTLQRSSVDGDRAARRARDRNGSCRSPGGIDAGAVLALQRTAGNRATRALLQRKRGPATEPVVDADTAAQWIIAWIKAEYPPGPGKQEENYSVGVAKNGDLYISKVGGVGEGVALIKKLGPKVEEQKLDVGRDIFLAQKFNPAYMSGWHAEMCVLAAAGLDALEKIYCAAPHCAFCAALMKKANVGLGAAVGGSDQTSWAHPFAPIFLGSSVNNDTNVQLTALMSLDPKPTEKQAVGAGLKWWSTQPKGACRLWK